MSFCATKPQPSVANHVPAPKKNPLLYRIAEFYCSKIPTGVREFVVMGPLLLVTCIFVYNMQNFVPEKMGEHMHGNQQVDMLTYRLEPQYNEQGKLFAYRRVAIKE